MTIFGSLKRWAARIRRDIVALWIAARDSRVPWHAKALAACVAAYALSPIDLIPDVIPVIGYLDDLLIVPLGIMLAVRLVSPALMSEFRAAAVARGNQPVSMAGAAFIVLAWIATAILAGWMIWPWLSARA